MPRTPATPLLNVIVVGAMFALAVAVCIVLAKNGHPAEAMLGGVCVLVGAGVTTAVLVRAPAPADNTESAPALNDIRTKVEELSDTVREMAAQNALSADARRVLFRKQEREILLQAIEGDITEREWDAAASLVGELADRLGYTAEAERLRVRIASARAAQGEASAASPPGAATWGADTNATRESRKSDLEQRFMAAAAEGRAEEAMVILAELDQFLTPDEAQPLRDIARDVIARTRDAMGEQFKAAVQTKRWPEAVTVGQEIVTRFPNTRMATEVRDVLDALRAKAGA